MDKYRKIIKPREEAAIREEEIRVTSQGSVSAYVTRAAKVFNELEKPHVVVAATGNALTKAVTAAEVIKRRFKGLHQTTKIGSREVVDEYEPLEEGLDIVSETRHLPFIEITLSKEALDTLDLGYQAPLDESEVTEYDAEEMAKGRGRGGGRGKGKGKGKGKYDEGSKGKGKSKGEASGKGKGKRDQKGGGGDWGKGNRKGKDWDSGYGREQKGGGGGWGKGNRKGKDDSRGKGGGWDSGYGSYNRGNQGQNQNWGGGGGNSWGRNDGWNSSGQDRSYGGGYSRDNGNNNRQGGWY